MKEGPLHPYPALSPSEARAYAEKEATLLSGFTVDEEHAILLCERDIEYRHVSYERSKNNGKVRFVR